MVFCPDFERVKVELGGEILDLWSYKHVNGENLNAVKTKVLGSTTFRRCMAAKVF